MGRSPEMPYFHKAVDRMVKLSRVGAVTTVGIRNALALKYIFCELTSRGIGYYFLHPESGVTLCGALVSDTTDRATRCLSVGHTKSFRLQLLHSLSSRQRESESLHFLHVIYLQALLPVHRGR